MEINTNGYLGHIKRVSVKKWLPRLFRLPISGWKKCLHDAASFDSSHEYVAATILDSDASVKWWMRNDPPIFRIPTVAGFFEPDFIVSPATEGQTGLITALEIKGGFLWSDPDGDAQTKIKGAVEWAKAANIASTETHWNILAVLDQDVSSVATFGQMAALSVAS